MASVRAGKPALQGATASTGVSKRIGLVRGAAAHAIVTATACVLAVLLFAAYHMRRQGGPGTWPEMIRRVGPPAASSEAAVHSAQTMSDAEIEQACMRYRVPDPAQYRADHAALAQALVHALRTGGGTGRLMQNITFQQQMATLTLEERERIAMEVGTAVYHGPEEAMLVNAAEEEAVLRAAPHSQLELLNGLNVGVGSRQVHPSLIGIDAHRGMPEGSGDLPAHQSTAGNTVLAWADQLPFKPNSIDYIISLHNLEHLWDPVAAVLHYLDVLKPGGGLGVVIPNWRFAWDARNDDTEWGHRWNTAPEVVCRLYHKHWSHLADLEQLNTLTHRVSFDFVLRKKGKFPGPFPQVFPSYPTGRDLYCAGKFIGPANMPGHANGCSKAQLVP